MRPLYNPDYGLDSKDDFDLCMANEALYDELMARNEAEIEKGRIKFMGPGFATRPLPTFKELSAAINSKLDIIKRQPQNPLIELYQAQVNELTDRIKARNYTDFKDKDAMSYKKAFEAKEELYYKSEVYLNVQRECYKHNREVFDQL